MGYGGNLILGLSEEERFLDSFRTPLTDQEISLGTSLVVQWIRVCLAMQETWVQPLVGELRSHMPPSN